jgi:hypothetical protein
MVVAHHAGQSYGDTGGAWLIFDEKKVNGLQHFFFINASYLMALYFFISGYFTYSSIKNKTINTFIKDRFKKLGIPLVIITFLIFLPLHFFSDSNSMNLLPFICDLYFNKPPLAVGHLWFVLSLLAYSILFIFIFKCFRFNDKRKKLSLFHPLAFVIIVSVTGYFIRLHFPIDKWVTWIIPIEPAHLPLYLFSFYSGLLAYKNEWLYQFSWKFVFSYSGLLLLVIIIMNNHFFDFNLSLANVVLESLICCSISLTIITFFKSFENKINITMHNISVNSYGIYLVHLFFVLLFQYFLLGIDLSGFLKFILVTILSFLSSWGFTYLLRRNHNVATII